MLVFSIFPFHFSLSHSPPHYSLFPFKALFFLSSFCLPSFLPFTHTLIFVSPFSFPFFLSSLSPLTPYVIFSSSSDSAQLISLFHFLFSPSPHKLNLISPLPFPLPPFSITSFLPSPFLSSYLYSL